MGSIFPLVELGQPNLSVLLLELPEEIKTKLFAEVQDAHLKNLAKVRSWQSKLEAYFKTCYQVYDKVIKFVRVLDKHWRSILCKSGSFFCPSKHLKGKTGKGGLLKTTQVQIL